MENDLVSRLADKYSDQYYFESEQKAVEQFESIKRSSTNNLRKSQKRMMTASTVVLLLAALLGVLAFITNLRNTRDITYLYEGPLTARFYAERAESSMLRVYGAMRNLALSNADNKERIALCLAEIEEYTTTMDADFNALYSLDLNEADESLRPKFLELENLLSEWRELRATSLEYVSEGNMYAFRSMLMGENSKKASEISGQIAGIIRDSTVLANEDQTGTLARSRAFGVYTVLLVLLILAIGVSVMVYTNRYFSRAVVLIEDAQEQQSDILGELVVMDETLRQNVAALEREGETIKEMQEKYRNSLEASNDVIWDVDLKTREFFVSEKWEDVTGAERMPRYDRRRIFSHIYKQDRKGFRDMFRKASGYFNTEIRTVNPDLSLRWLGIRGKWIDKYRMTGSISDITLKKQAEQYIEYMAYHDELTGLPNRAMFIRTLSTALDKARETGHSCCILFIDIDNFKLINDSHGHNFGDKLLSEVADRFRDSVGENSMLARFGGDEFLMLIENISGTEDILGNIGRLSAALEDPISIDSALFHITTSIGVSVFPEDGDNVDVLLKNADSAMFESKSAGRGTFTFYNNDMSDRIVRSAAIFDVLHSAIESGAANLAFQPQYSLKENRVVGCEALMRLRDPELGFISPAEFIPIAEESRLIIPLGYWVIRKSIEADLALRDQGIELDGISVNVSEIQLRESDFVHRVKDIVSEFSYPADRLHFEITESALLNNLEKKIEIFSDLRELGFHIELDDFGTGYSSLNYVRMIPLTAIKIDKCFTDEIGVSMEKEGLIDIIIRLADMFGANVIAEGVETAGQVDFFRQKGDVAIQGYYYSRPLEIKDLPAKIIELNSSVDKS